MCIWGGVGSFAYQTGMSMGDFLLNTAITGGKGSIQGTFLGVLLFAVLSNSLTLLKIPSFYYKVFTGLIILVSVAGSAMQIKRQENKKVRVQVDAPVSQ